MDKYTTTQGDTFDTIAFRIWGNEKMMHKLIEVNPDHQGTVIFSARVELNIPEIETPVEKGPVPPWQK